jgi:hypothetical protein
MRRPLTPNGVPFVQAGDVSVNDVIFDVNDLDPDYAYAVTLYCWAPNLEVPEYGAPVVSAGIATDGAPVVPTALLSVVPGDNFDAYRINGNGPAKVMDRIPMRGNQQLVVAKLTPAAPPNESNVYWFGYFERVGATPVPVDYRPLLPDGPSGLASPYNAPTPGLVVPPNGGSVVTTPVHQLDGSGEQRIDYLWLDVASNSDNPAPDGSPTVVLNLPGGVSMEMLVPANSFTPPAQGGSPVRIFDGIPFRAPSNDDNLIELAVTGDDTVATITAITAGRFARL